MRLSHQVMKINLAFDLDFVDYIGMNKHPFLKQNYHHIQYEVNIFVSHHSSLIRALKHILTTLEFFSSFTHFTNRVTYTES